MVKIMNHDIIHLKEEIEKLNKSGLSISKYLDSIPDKYLNPLFKICDTTQFVINQDNYYSNQMYRSYISLSFGPKVIRFESLLLRSNGVYHLSIYDCKSPNYIKLIHSAIRRYIIGYLKIKLLNRPFVFKFISQFKVEILNINEIDNYIKNHLFICNVLKNKKINDFYFNRNVNSESFLPSDCFSKFNLFLKNNKKSNDFLFLLQFMASYQKTSNDGVYIIYAMASFISYHLKNQQIINHIINKKFSLSEENYPLLCSIIEKKDNLDSFKKQISTKIATITTTKSFNVFLDSFLNKLNNWNYNETFIKIKKSGAPFFVLDNIIIIKIETFKHSKEFGSQAWCIQQLKSSFDEIVSSQIDQYFIFDFNYNFHNDRSLIGISISPLHINSVYLQQMFSRSNESLLYTDRYRDKTIFIVDHIMNITRQKKINTIKEKKNKNSIIFKILRYLSNIYVS